MNRSNISLNSDMKSMEAIAFQDVPLTALSKKTFRRLSYLLNTKKIFPSKHGFLRDWRGLACLAEIKYFCDENAVGLEDQITKVIQLWCTYNPKTATFAYLVKFLGIIDRWDVSDDIYENLVEDTKTYQIKQLNDQNIKSIENENFDHELDSNILTTADVVRAQKGLPPKIYDAFVLYADADHNYATEMQAKLENNSEYNFKLCMKDRDLLAGVQFKHVALTQLIEERCKRFIVILTQNFLKSPENKFLVNYTQALQIQHDTRKVIPLLYEDGLNLPRTLKIYTHLRYNSGSTSLVNFWSKLAYSIDNFNATANGSFTQTLIQTKEKSELNNLKTTAMNTVHSISGMPVEDLSTTSLANNNKKRKQKWSSKILKKVFTHKK